MASCLCYSLYRLPSWITLVYFENSKSPKTAFDLRQLILLFVFGSTTVAYLEKYIYKT